MKFVGFNPIIDKAILVVTRGQMVEVYMSLERGIHQIFRMRSIPKLLGRLEMDGWILTELKDEQVYFT